MFNDTLIDNTIWILRKAFKSNKAQIWKALEKEFSRLDQTGGKLTSKDWIKLLIAGI